VLPHLQHHWTTDNINGLHTPCLLFIIVLTLYPRTPRHPYSSLELLFLHVSKLKTVQATATEAQGKHHAAILKLSHSLSARTPEIRAGCQDALSKGMR